MEARSRGGVSTAALAYGLVRSGRQRHTAGSYGLSDSWYVLCSEAFDSSQKSGQSSRYWVSCPLQIAEP